MKADYTKARPEELAVLCNGCGPQRFPRLRPYVPQWVFKEAGNRHDWDYWVGGGRVAYVRANLRFLANCLLAVSDNSPWKCMAAHLVFSALYYLAVKYGGAASFHWGTPRTMEQMATIAADLKKGARRD